MTLLTFARTYIMPKELSTEPTHRRKDIIVIVRPYCSPDPNGPNYEQYCRQKLMLHIKFRQLSDLLIGNTTYTEAYQQVLLSANVPSSLEEDILRLEVEQPTEDEAQEVFINNEYTVESQLPELTIFQCLDNQLSTAYYYIL